MNRKNTDIFIVIVSNGTGNCDNVILAPLTELKWEEIYTMDKGAIPPLPHTSSWRGA
jgi:hypothetical protein